MIAINKPNNVPKNAEYINTRKAISKPPSINCQLVRELPEAKKSPLFIIEKLKKLLLVSPIVRQSNGKRTTQR